MHGIFENGLPWVKLDILENGEKPTSVSVIVDTGFNGYLALPYALAFPIGFTLLGVGSGKIADGSFSPHLVGGGTVFFGTKRIKTTIDIQPNCRPLLGTELLKEMGCILKVDPIKGTVELTEIR
jgi:clan AA aspartic protease